MTARAAPRPLPPPAALAVLGVVVAAAIVARLATAPGGFAWPESSAIFEIRAVRIVSALIVGASLSVAGALLQGILRNPLASPFLLGMTSGAGLGIVIATYAAYLATGQIVQHRVPILPAILGAGAALAIVYALGHRRGALEPTRLILMGLIISLLCGAVTSLLQHMLPDRGMAIYTRWVMGSISEETSWATLGIVGAIAAVGIAWACTLGRPLDAATLTDDEAASVGVRIQWLRVRTLVLAGVLTGVTVVLAGPIGFVGLLCPHLVRLIAGHRNTTVLIGSALAGAALVVVSDIVVSMPTLASGRIPVGVITTLVGAPVFIALAWRARL
jgi:iron complex transport system permease protein